MVQGLLPLYVTIDTARALLMYALLHSGVKLSPTAISLGSEACKLVVASIAVAKIGKSSPDFGQTFFARVLLPTYSTSTWRNLVPYLRYAVPAALFLGNNVMYLGGLSIVTPALLQTCVLSKLPLTALLHHLVIKPRRNSAMWISLACLSFGLVLAGSPDALWDAEQRKTIPVRDLVAGPVIGLTIGIVSACSSIWTELVFKDQVPFWTAQFWLYLWGTVLAAMASLLAQTSESAAASTPKAGRGNTALPFLAVVVVAAASGLSVAAILKQKDNLVKLVGSSLCITTLYIGQHLLFPLAEEVEARQIIGIGILTVSTWAYNFHKDEGASGAMSAAAQKKVDGAAYSALDTKEDRAGSDLARGSAPAVSSVLRPTPRRLGICAAVIVMLATLPHFLPRPARSIKRDFKSFFSPRHIYPVSWEELPAPDTQRCIVETFDHHVELEQHPSLLADWEERVVHSRCAVYPVPDAGLLFHARWSGDAATPGARKSHRLATDAFLATQRLKDGHRLIWWYRTESNADDAVTVFGSDFYERYLQPESPFYRYVEVQRIHDEALSRGTCAASLVSGLESPVVPDDLERTLILSRYGGIWIDGASVLMRDLTPLIRTGPLVPTKAKHAWAIGPTFEAVCEEEDNDDDDGHDPNLAKAVPPELHGIYSWQAQLRRRPDADPCWNERSGSVLSAVKTRVEAILDTMPLRDGIDLFPGPGYADHTKLRRRRL
ncbi:hypothetical protein JCM3774_006300 [Rhodotorula dairenensis]